MNLKCTPFIRRAKQSIHESQPFIKKTSKCVPFNFKGPMNSTRPSQRRIPARPLASPAFSL